MIMVTQEDQQLLAQFQMYQQQLQSIMIQKENIKLQQLEIEKALEEIESSKEKNAYKISGPIMIKKDIDDIKTELKENEENIQLRIKTLGTAETKITGKLKEMESSLKKMVGK